MLLEKNAVRLSTVHKAKGQEWQIVFIPGLIDGKWGNSKKRQLLPLPQELIPNATITPEETNAEERRLFYVALTRAKTNVYLSYSESVVNENRSKSVNQSEFLVALLEQQSSNFKTLLATDSLPKLDAQLERLLLPANSQRKLQSQEKEYYTELTDILRSYIDHRFGIDAPEMISEDIISAVHLATDTRSATDGLAQILRLADMVKFAKYVPFTDENDLSLVNAYLFVNQTKIEERPTLDEQKEGGEGTAVKNKEENKAKDI